MASPAQRLLRLRRAGVDRRFGRRRVHDRFLQRRNLSFVAIARSTSIYVKGPWRSESQRSISSPQDSPEALATTPRKRQKPRETSSRGSGDRGKPVLTIRSDAAG